MLASLARPLGTFERVLWAVDQWTPRHFVVVARIEGRPMTANYLKPALSEAQQRHPALRVGIRATDAVPRFVNSYKPIKLQVIERQSEARWQIEAQAQLELPFQAEEGPLLRAVLVQGGAASELILAVHHSIGDGISAMYFVRDLLQSLQGQQLAELPARGSLEELSASEAWVPSNQSQISRSIRAVKSPWQTHDREF